MQKSRDDMILKTFGYHTVSNNKQCIFRRTTTLITKLSKLNMPHCQLTVITSLRPRRLNRGNVLEDITWKQVPKQTLLPITITIHKVSSHLVYNVVKDWAKDIRNQRLSLSNPAIPPEPHQSAISQVPANPQPCLWPNFSYGFPQVRSISSG